MRTFHSINVIAKNFDEAAEIVHKKITWMKSYFEKNGYTVVDVNISKLFTNQKIPTYEVFITLDTFGKLD